MPADLLQSIVRKEFKRVLHYKQFYQYSPSLESITNYAIKAVQSGTI